MISMTTDSAPTIQRAESVHRDSVRRSGRTSELRDPSQARALSAELAPTATAIDVDPARMSDTELAKRLVAEQNYLNDLRRERGVILRGERTKAKDRRLKVVEWILNRAELARLQPDLDHMRKRVEEYQELASDVRALVRALAPEARRPARVR